MLEFTAIEKEEKCFAPILLRALDIVQVVENEEEMARKQFKKQVVIQMIDGSYIAVRESFDEVKARINEYNLLDVSPYIEFFSLMDDDKQCRTLLRVGSIISVSVNDGETQIELKSKYNNQNISMFIFTKEDFETIKAKILSAKNARCKRNKTKLNPAK